MDIHVLLSFLFPQVMDTLTTKINFDIHMRTACRTINEVGGSVFGFPFEGALVAFPSGYDLRQGALAVVLQCSPEEPFNGS